MATAQEGLLELGVGPRIPCHLSSSLAVYRAQGAHAKAPVHQCHLLDGAFFDDALFCFAGRASDLLFQAPFVAAVVIEAFAPLGLQIN
eukprot:4774588-Pyramimonas_sp.AAC.1